MSARSLFTRILVALPIFMAAALPSLAGDKIIFSDPSRKLESFDQPKEETSFLKSAIPSFGDAQAPTPIVFNTPPIIGPTKRRDDHKEDKWGSLDPKTDKENLGATDRSNSRWESSASQWEDSGDKKNSTAHGTSTGMRAQDDRPNGRKEELDNSRSGKLEDYFGSNLTERRSYRPGSDRNSALNDLLSNRRLPIADTLREEQADRMNEFKAFYQLPSSTAPVGSPSPSANPIHDYNWQNAPRLPTATDLAPRKVADDYSRVTPNTAYFDKPDVKNRSVFGVDSSVPRSQALQSTSRRGSSVVLELPKRPGELTR